MLKKVLCMIIAVITIMTTCAITSVGAAETDAMQTEATAKTLIIGDVDLDGLVTIKDASLLQSALVGLSELSDEQWIVSKIADGTSVTIMDVTEIQLYVAGFACSNRIGTELNPPIEDEQPTEDEVISIDDTEAIENAIAIKFMEYVNEERIKVGVQPLEINETLTKAASIRGDEITDSFSHTRPNGESFFTVIENRNDFGMLGENIACNAGIFYFNDPEEVNETIDAVAKFFFGQFKSSEGHYKNMINKNFNCHGVDITIVNYDGYSEFFATHLFAETR